MVLGFAGILNEIGVAESYFITSLISFNIGVEIGQLLVISICFVSIGFWFGQKKWYRNYLTNPLSAIIATHWLVLVCRKSWFFNLDFVMIIYGPNCTQNV